MPSMEGEQEFEVLESIYEEIEILRETPDGTSHVSILLYPKSADDLDSRNVTLKLEFKLPSTYPVSLPYVDIRNPRGLSEAQLQQLKLSLEGIKKEFSGSPMLFQLIDMVHDYLTLNNRPSAECPICLMSFTEFDVFYTPSCFHHYHSHCLGLHLQTLLKAKKENADSQGSMPSSPVEMCCPVCRLQLDSKINIEKLVASPPASEDFTPVEVKGVERGKLDALFQKQKKQGGIIDLNKDCKRLLRISGHNDAPPHESSRSRSTEL